MKFVHSASVVLVLLALVQVSQCDLKEIKLKDILGGMYQNVRHALLQGLKNSTYQLEWIRALDLFTDKLTVEDVLQSFTDGGQNLFAEVLQAAGDAFAKTGIQKEVVATFAYLIKYGSMNDLLAIFTGYDQTDYWRIFTEGMELSFQNSTALPEMKDEFAIGQSVLNKGQNNQAQSRLKDQYNQTA